MHILIMPEDFRHDQYLLPPLFASLFRRHLRLPRAKIVVCQNPKLGGVGEALKRAKIQAVVERYQYRTDIFILCVDRDGDTARRGALDALESHMQNTNRFFFLAENAWEEIETWILAGLDLPKDGNWADVRAAIHVKEEYFDQLVKMRDIYAGPGREHKDLGREATWRIARIRQLCPEDFGTLSQRLGCLLSLP